MRWDGLKSAIFDQYLAISQQFSAAADRPMRCSVSGPPSCIQMSMVSVINLVTETAPPVYHTDRTPKLTAPETIIRSRDIVGVHQNLNGACDLTMPLSWFQEWFAIRGLALATINLPTKFDISPHYENMKDNT